MESDVTEQERFDAVWQRVVRENPGMEQQPRPVGKSDGELLEQFMDAAALAARYYELLGARLSDRTLTRLAARQRQTVKRLRTAYYILTGRTYTPQTASPRFTGIADTLRRRYLAEGQEAEACCKAAANTADRDLSALFADLCRQKKQTRQALETLLERIMG